MFTAKNISPLLNLLIKLTPSTLRFSNCFNDVEC